MISLLALATLAHPQTQDPVVLFAEGDPHPGGGTIPVSFTGFIGRHGSWAARIPVTSSGERPGLIRDGVAVLLDGAQSAALDRLPFASDLKVVASSKPVPTSLLCSVGDRIDGTEMEHLNQALLKLHESQDGDELLSSLRLVRFHPLDGERLDRLQALFAGAPD